MDLDDQDPAAENITSILDTEFSLQAGVHLRGVNNNQYIVCKPNIWNVFWLSFIGMKCTFIFKDPLQGKLE